MKYLKGLTKITSYFTTIQFIRNNYYAAKEVPDIDKTTFAKYSYSGYQRQDYVAIGKLFNEAFHTPFSNRNKLLLKLLGAKTCYVARNINSQVLASILFYFNYRDIIEKTIHLGFIAVSKDIRNTGIGSNILKYAVNDLEKRTDVCGISSRVTVSNLASMNVHLKTGFEIEEEYFDNERGEKRAYLILRFND